MEKLKKCERGLNLLKIITNTMENEEIKVLTLEEINELLSDALLKVSLRKISLKQAAMISKLAQSLTKNITVTQLKDRIEFLEQKLKSK